MYLLPCPSEMELDANVDSGSFGTPSWLVFGEAALRSHRISRSLERKTRDASENYSFLRFVPHARPPRYQIAPPLHCNNN
jgi:hypothetical protein